MQLEFLLLNSHREYFSLVYSFLHLNAKPTYYSGSQLGIPRSWDLKCDFQEWKFVYSCTSFQKKRDLEAYKRYYSKEHYPAYIIIPANVNS